MQPALELVKVFGARTVLDRLSLRAPPASTSPSWGRAAPASRPCCGSSRASSNRTAARPARQAMPRGLGTALLAPGAAWMVLFLVAPIPMMVYVSFWTQKTFTVTPELTTRSWAFFFGSAIYLKALWTNLRIWLTVLVTTLLAGYPVALYIGLFVRDMFLCSCTRRWAYSGC